MHGPERAARLQVEDAPTVRKPAEVIAHLEHQAAGCGRIEEFIYLRVRPTERLFHQHVFADRHSAARVRNVLKLVAVDDHALNGWIAERVAALDGIRDTAVQEPCVSDAGRRSRVGRE